ncbi:hypothetical protein MA16_Dca018445 [Dendrobium catenatum]|uniref:Uncharacterized protein n=1 Tax=Dendrobium catenatum TaxID=906689 RepID=A0A2I0XF98_9ASPA|nr:hypothetical protein MA16_Dca018445 [Dendrobium catenatum]
MDRNLWIPNHSHALTTKNCVLCSCSSTTWQLESNCTLTFIHIIAELLFQKYFTICETSY